MNLFDASNLCLKIAIIDGLGHILNSNASDRQKGKVLEALLKGPCAPRVYNAVSNPFRRNSKSALIEQLSPVISMDAATDEQKEKVMSLLNKALYSTNPIMREDLPCSRSNTHNSYRLTEVQEAARDALTSIVKKPGGPNEWKTKAEGFLKEWKLWLPPEKPTMGA